MVRQVDENELTKEEIERRAGELAARVMSMPPQPRVKPKGAKVDKTDKAASNPQESVS
jgi:hypothetical protein